MKKTHLRWMALLLPTMLAGCFEKSDYPYNAAKDNIYFYYPNADDYHITYSFADTTQDVTEITLLLPVKISGERVNRLRTFRVEVVDSLTTAQPTTHYRALADTYTLPVDSGTFPLPVVLYNTDEALQENTLTLALRLVNSDDFDTGFPNLVTTIISFSSRLEQPSWWMYWISELGTYSRTKHFLFLISSGTKALSNPSAPDGWMYTPKSLYHISEYKAFLADPFGWVAKHPEYALDKEAGNDDYLFYLKTTPAKTYLLKWEAGTGKYFFIDENGQTIS